MVEKSVVEKFATILVEELSDVRTGTMSDMGFVRAECNDEGALELFDTDAVSAWPVASFDVNQLAYVLASRVGEVV